MKKIVFCIIILLLNSFVFGQSGWFQQNSGTAKDIVDIQFLNNNTGYAVAKDHETANCSVLKSTNSGLNWVSIFSSSPAILYALCFINENTGSVCGGNGAAILKTTNGGVTWLPQQNPGSDIFRRFYYQNPDTAYAVGFISIVRTTNSGANWVIMFNLNEAFWSDIIFINQKTGISVGASNMKTTNSGNSWSTSGIFGFGISNFGENNIMACGYSGIYKSTDYGISSTRVYAPSPGDPGGLFCIKYLDASTVISAGSSGRILKTTNNGNNWFTQQSNVKNVLFRMTFIDQQTGWIGGDYGLILKTTTGGVITGFTQTSSEIPDKFSLSQNYPNPFNPSTNISYQLAFNGNVTLKVYSLLGNEVETLVNEKQSAGSYSVNFNALSLPGGIYFYKLVTEKFSETKKMILVK